MALKYTVCELITNAFYLSKVRSKDFMDVGNDDTTVGLSLLNEVLAETAINTRMIPYYKEVTINGIVGVDQYFVAGLVQPFSVTFLDTVVRYATQNQTRREFFSTTKIMGVQAYPFNTHLERVMGGCNLNVYFVPCKDFPFRVFGKFSLELLEVSNLTDNLLLTYDMFYIRYLRHLLALEICNYYGVEMNPEIKYVLDRISGLLNDMNPLDLTTQKIDTYSERNQLNWALVNLGKGFEP